MARKNLLQGLMEARDTTDDGTVPARVDVARPRYGTGAIGAVSQSIADLKARSVIEIDPDLIDAGGLADRIEESGDDHAALMASIRDYGQQVPILVRPHPDELGRFQIVYGRRRLLALRALGQPAKALVRNLDDTALVMAQGQENSARRDLSFIEKCNFARQMRDAGYERKAICDALSVDKTLISRMLSIIDRIPVEIIERIGSAPGIGRDRWSDFADRYIETQSDHETLGGMIELLANDSDSDARFAAALSAMGSSTPAPSKPRATPVRGKSHTVQSVNGLPIGKVTRKPDQMVLTLPTGDGFDDWLIENLTEIYRSWFSSRDE